MLYFYEAQTDTPNYHYIKHKMHPFTYLHFHSAPEFIFVRRGKMLANIRGEKYVIETNEGCFVDSFGTHTYREMEDDTEIYIFVGNRDLFTAIFTDVSGVPAAKFAFDDFDILDRATSYYENTQSHSLRLAYFKGTAELLLASIAEKNTLLPFSEGVFSEKICAVLGYINEHFTENITLSSIAAEFGYSPQYFSRLFHKYMNVNITEYINIARVNYAQKLLADDKSVAQIAFESGFNSMPSFYRVYKKVFGGWPRG